MKKFSTSQDQVQIWAVKNNIAHARPDLVAIEEPLEIRLGNPQKTVAITMRTPGADFDLVAGFLYSEGLIQQKADLQTMRYCVDSKIAGQQRQNIVTVQLRAGLMSDLPSLDRYFLTNSSCGVCGKTSIEALKMQGYQIMPQGYRVNADILYGLVEQLQAAQKIFASTGGLHAAAIFDFQGQLLKLQEDIGRHNALDKLIGSALLADELPLTNRIVMVSGRSSFEILQKSIRAGVPIICAVSAPSSLAVGLAKEFGVTLIGFLRDKRFNVYTGWEHILRE